MKIVLDTNVLISAHLQPLGKPARILDMVFNGELSLMVDDRIFYEYREVINRSRFGLSPMLVEQTLSFLEKKSQFVVCSPSRLKIPDPDDLPFLEVALTGQADVLVTGNKKDYGKSPKGLKILNPAEFLHYLKSHETPKPSS